MIGCYSCVASQGFLCLDVSGHGSSGQTCSSRLISRPLSRPTHQALGPLEVRHENCHTCVSKGPCVSKGLFNLHGPPRQGAIWRVYVFKRSCSHFSQVYHAERTRAHTDTKEGKTQANYGFCRGFSILLAEIGSGCAHRFHQSHIPDDLVSSLCWFAAGWLLLLLLLLRCAVLLLVCWRWLATTAG